METVELKINLSRQNLEFAERYAREHQITVAELIIRYLQRLQAATQIPIHPDVQAMTGLIPAEVDIEALLRERALKKNG